MNTRLTSAACLALAFAAGCGLAQADEPRYNQVSLRAEVSNEVAHDRMQVVLYVEEQGKDPAALASKVTQQMNSALEQARKVKAVQTSQGSRNSYPVYDKEGKQLSGWRERAELRLESSDFAALSSLTGELLEQMKMGGMGFSLSDGLRKQNEDGLIKEAIGAFRARAQLTSEALGGKGYRIVSLNLSSNGVSNPRPVYAMAKGPVMRDSMSAGGAPEVEAGSSQVQVSADGTIEVQMP